MSPLLSLSVRNRLRKIMLSSGFVLLFSTYALAGPLKEVRVTGSGGVTTQGFCSTTEYCREATFQGTATHIGTFIGVLSERLDIITGTYKGTAVFTTADGSTITTKYTGVDSYPDANGRVFFAENHQIAGGTGKYADVSGELAVAGVADASTGRFQITGIGTLSK